MNAPGECRARVRVVIAEVLGHGQCHPEPPGDPEPPGASEPLGTPEPPGASEPPGAAEPLGDPGLPEQAASMLARELRDAGHEAIHLGTFSTEPGHTGSVAVNRIVQAVLQEDADVVGLVAPVALARCLVPRLTQVLAEREAADVRLFALSGETVGEDVVCFTPRTLEEVASWVRLSAPPSPGS